MKKVLIVVGSLALVGGALYYVHNVYIPKVHLVNVNYGGRSITVKVRGKLFTMTATPGMGVVAPIPFSKYTLELKKSQLNADDDNWIVALFDGSSSVSQPGYVNFKNKTNEFF